MALYAEDLSPLERVVPGVAFDTGKDSSRGHIVCYRRRVGGQRMTSVSVVVPTRNRSNLLATTLHSVLWQRDVELEVIVVDEASTDNTADLVAAFVDPRVTLMRNSVPHGASAARNQGAARARGEWVAFVDDDDVWAPDKLIRQVAAAEESGRDWAYTGAVNVGRRLEIVSGGPAPSSDGVMEALPRYNPIPGGSSNVIIRRSMLAAVGGFDERLPPCEDWELSARLARAGPPASVDGLLVGYRLHAGNSSLDIARILGAVRLIEQLHGREVDWGRMHRWLAESHLRTGDRARAVGRFARAAMHGQARGVASDLAAILRRRVARTFGWPRHQTSRSTDGWVANAAVWLRELDRRAREGAEGVRRA